MTAQDREALLNGERVVGRFQVAGTDGDVPGALQWTANAGATLELIGETAGFPREFETPRFEVFGELSGGTQITLQDCWVRRMRMFDQPTHVAASTLAFGAHALSTERWPRAIYSTGALGEWRNDTGLDISYPKAGRRRLGPLRLDIVERTRDIVDVAGASLTFTGDVETSSIGHRPDFWARSRAVMLVDTTVPRTADRFLDRYALPLRALLSLAADEPDDLTYEVYVDVAAGRRIELWRGGRDSREPEWRMRQLFGADDLRNYERAIRAWWRLHGRVWPAINLFGDHVGEGSSFSPGRFRTLYSAVERYAKVQHSTKDFRKLRDYAGIDTELTGCTNRVLRRIDITRGYVAHFNNVDEAGRTEVEENMVSSTRRLSALMQACLLRHLGFNKRERSDLMAKHYRGWPL